MRARILMLAALGATVAACALGLPACGGGSAGYTVYATFDNAGGILKNYQVKVSQVRAGVVKAITLDGNDNAVVRMELDRGAAPIGRGASARVRPVNLLGEKYIDLDPGDLSHSLPSGAEISKSATGVPVELDDLLNMLDPDTRGALRILVNEAGLGMAGRGADFNRLLTDLPPALDSARRPVAQLGRENEALDRLIVSGDRVLASVAPRGHDLGDLVESASGALGTLADRRRQLGETVRSAPAGAAAPHAHRAAGLGEPAHPDGERPAQDVARAHVDTAASAAVRRRRARHAEDSAAGRPDRRRQPGCDAGGGK